MSRLVPSLRIIVLGLALAFLADPPVCAAESPSCPECESCVRKLLAELEQRGWLGMALHLHEDSGRDGLEIQFLSEDGPVAEVGLRPGDRVLEFQGVDLTSSSPEEIMTLLQEVRPGERVVLKVIQAGERREITLWARPMTLRAKAEALGSFFIRASALERKDQQSDRGDRSQ